MNIYFASPLFSNMERKYNEYLTSMIRENYPEVEMYVPQEQMGINDKNAYADSIAIAKYDTDALLASDLMVAVLDGAIVEVKQQLSDIKDRTDQLATREEIEQIIKFRRNTRMDGV